MKNKKQKKESSDAGLLPFSPNTIITEKKKKIKEYLYKALTEVQKELLFDYILSHDDLTRRDKVVAEIKLRLACNPLVDCADLSKHQKGVEPLLISDEKKERYAKAITFDL